MIYQMNSYTKINYINGTAPPLSAENLNHMEDGIEAATQGVTELEADVANKADTADVEASLAAKANKTDVNTEFAKRQLISNMISDIRYATEPSNQYPSIAYLDGYYYDCLEIDGFLDTKANKTDVDSALADITKKQDEEFRVSDIKDVTDEEKNYPSIKYLNGYFYDINETYSMDEIDEKLGNKADNAVVISGCEGVLSFALYSDFVQGQTNSSDGELNTDVKYRVTSEDIMQFDYDLNVTVDEGFTGYVVKYVDGSYESVYSLGNAKYNYVIPAGTEFRLHIRRAVEDTTETANISEFVNAVKFLTKTAAEVAKKADKAEATETKEAVEDIKAYIGYDDEDIAGICVDYQNKTFKRLAGACDKSAGTDFDSFPMFGGRKRCNVSDDGTIVAYYGDADYAEDGSNGQVMTYQPAFYYKVVPLVFDKNTDTGIGYHLRKANYYVSSKPKTGFKLHPAFYDENGNPVDYILLSAYEGSMWDDSADAYVNDNIDTSIAYAAGDLLCSVAGKKPISGLRTGMGTKANFEAMAKNRGIGWHLETIKATSANQLLMMIELGTMNTQTGIGQGVVSVSDNSSYNCSSLTGSTASLGNATGEATATINEIGGTETVYTTSGKLAVTYRGVENPWGNIWKHINGANIWGDSTMGGGQIYIANDFNFNESKHSDNYKAAGFTLANANGYISAMGYGGEDYDWLFFPSEAGGTSALPVGDYTSVSENLNGYHITQLGGKWNVGVSSGSFYWYCTNNVGYYSRTVGGRLLYVPAAKSDKTDVDSALAAKADNTTVVSISEGVLNFTPYSNFVLGQIGTSGAYNPNIKYRVISEDIMQFDYDLNVTVDEGFIGYVVEYNEDGSCKNSPPTKSLANYNNTIPAGTEFKLHIRRAVEDTTETANISEFVNAVKFLTKTAADITEIDGRVKVIEEKINTESEDDSIPDYYYADNYLPDKINEIKEACSILHGVTFAFISDVHFKVNQKQSKKLLRKILNETNVPFVIFGGDTVYLYGTEDELHEQIAEFNNFKSYIGKDKLFCTRGNHDLYNVTSATDKTMHPLTTADVYDALFRDSEHSVSSMSVNNGCYCIDNEPQKTRIIMLNTSDLSNDADHTGGGVLFRASTLQWLSNALTEKENYKIIIVCHTPLNYETFNNDNSGENPNGLFEMVAAFKNKQTFETVRFNGAVQADFTNTANELICVVSGHRHIDGNSVENNVLNIVTTCDCIDVKDGYGRKAGTISEQAFDIYCIDYDTNTIKTVRIGAGENREFEIQEVT